MTFNHQITGEGIPFIFQHGLGGSLQQPQQLLKDLKGVMLISMDCRGHGKTPFTHVKDLSFNTFADDVISLCDSLGIEKAIFGGISMGAGVALNIAVRYPDRLKGLVLVRPAWLDQGNPDNIVILQILARLIQENKGKTITEKNEYRQIEKRSAGAAQAVLGQLNREQGEHTADVLIRITADKPVQNLGDLKNISVPCVVLANHNDPMHPFEFGEIIARKIPGSVFAEVTSRYSNSKEHEKDVLNQVSLFIKNNAYCD